MGGPTIGTKTQAACVCVQLMGFVLPKDILKNVRKEANVLSDYELPQDNTQKAMV